MHAVEGTIEEVIRSEASCFHDASLNGPLPMYVAGSCVSVLIQSSASSALPNAYECQASSFVLWITPITSRATGASRSIMDCPFASIQRLPPSIRSGRWRTARRSRRGKSASV